MSLRKYTCTLGNATKVVCIAICMTTGKKKKERTLIQSKVVRFLSRPRLESVKQPVAMCPSASILLVKQDTSLFGHKLSRERILHGNPVQTVATKPGESSVADTPTEDVEVTTCSGESRSATRLPPMQQACRACPASATRCPVPNG